jgi:Ca2+-binding RTX toxin-like protein
LGSGDDLALAGDGTDKYYGSYDDVLSEHDWWGLPETSCTSISSHSSACTGGDTMYGGNGDDYLEGTNRGDYLYGGADVDLVFGDPSPDVIRGGADEDFLYGEQGSDNINGGMGDDEIAGGSGNDTLHGHSGADTIDAADGELDYIYCGDDGDLDTVCADEVDKIDPSCQYDDVNKVSATSPAAAEGGANADDKQEQERDKRLVDRQQ